MNARSVVEGYFLRTKDNLVFEVKGVLHPDDRYIAYLRYAPVDVSSGEKPVMRKIYDLRARENYLQKRFREYLWFSEVLGRVVQAVPYDKVDSVLSPVQFLATLREKGEEISNLESVALDLVETLVRNTRVGWKDLGLTGSLLARTFGERSDIDLVVYGEAVCRRFYHDIEECFTSVPDMEKYSGQNLDSLVSFRWDGLAKHWGILRKLEKRKRLQGLYKGTDFFVRLVKLPMDLEYSFGDRLFKHMGECHLETSVIDARNSLFTPCSYTVDNNPEEVDAVASYRGRFTEHVRRDDRVTVCGRLEEVWDNQSDSARRRIVLGEEANHYLLPV
jgi:predicted nucleotidyltransferase